MSSRSQSQNRIYRYI